MAFLSFTQNAFFLSLRRFSLGGLMLAMLGLPTFLAACSPDEKTAEQKSTPDKTVEEQTPLGPEGRPVVLITGSNRGIGLALTKEYANQGWHVIATCRHPEKADILQSLSAKNPHVVIEKLDVTDLSAIDALAAKYKDMPIDVLLSNAGISGGRDVQTLGSFKYDAIDKVMAVNVIGPLKLAEAFVDNVAASKQKKMVTITSTQGSITKTFGISYFYRSSKTAVNIVMHNLAIDLKDRGIIVSLISPGMVDTDFMKGLPLPLIPPAQSAAMIYKVVDGLTLDKSGVFLNHRGGEEPW